MGFSKRDIFLMIALSQAKTVSSLLRMKDADSVGSDDIAADIMDFTVDCIQAAQSGRQLPVMPVELARVLGLQPVDEADETVLEAKVEID